jgi:hypothetical protein
MADMSSIDVSMDANNLYREEIVTDRQAGTLRMMVPITSLGTPDTARATLYVGEAQLMTQVGPLPISFEVDGKTLSEAIANYGAAAKAAIERTVAELQEMRRQAASGLIVPGSGGMGGMGGLPGGGFAAGGRGGGGKIQMP